jgi:hypothetical protein
MWQWLIAFDGYSGVSGAAGVGVAPHILDPNVVHALVNTPPLLCLQTCRPPSLSASSGMLVYFGCCAHKHGTHISLTTGGCRTEKVLVFGTRSYRHIISAVIDYLFGADILELISCSRVYG